MLSVIMRTVEDDLGVARLWERRVGVGGGKSVLSGPSSRLLEVSRLERHTGSEPMLWKGEDVADVHSAVSEVREFGNPLWSHG